MSDTHKGLNPALEIKDSPIEGRGIFAKVPFKKGDKIWITNAPKQPLTIMNDTEFTKFRKKCLEEDKQWDAVAIGNGKHQVGLVSREEDPSNFGNHSCNPNIAPDGGQVVALCDIQIGEEITIDYAQFSEVGWEMKCNCGSKNCKGVVKGKVK